MLISDWPRTLEAAEKRRYGNKPYNPNVCAAEVERLGVVYTGQCMKRPGHGPYELYCQQHAKLLAEHHAGGP